MIPRAKLALIEPPVRFLRSLQELPAGEMRQYAACELMDAVRQYHARYGHQPQAVYRLRTAHGVIWNMPIPGNAD